MRRRLMMQITKKGDAYALYPLNGDILDYSGNGRNLTKSNSTVYSNYVYVPRNGYLKLPFVLETSVDTTVSVSFKYLGKQSKRVYLWGRMSDTSGSWPKYANLIRLSNTSDSHYLTICLDGEVIDISNSVLTSNKVNNITITKSFSLIRIYVNGSLVKTSGYVGDNSNKGINYNPYVGNVNRINGLPSDGTASYIYGFAYYKKVLSDAEVLELASTLGFD